MARSKLLSSLSPYVIASITALGVFNFNAAAQDDAPEQPAPAMTQDTTEAAAQTTSAEDIDYANNLYLAHVKGPSSATNMGIKQGLTNLAAYMTEKTSVHPQGVASIDIENDDILFFPFIYWPISDSSPTLSAQAQDKVQDYINNGGVIVFDIQSPSAMRNSTLQRVLGDVEIRALEHADEDHTLTRTFYLLNSVEQGRTPVWVEQEDLDNPENISSVIISQDRWFEAWTGVRYQPGTDEIKQAFQLGVNLVMYSVTGDYKQDPQHNRAVLEKIELRNQ